MTDVPLVRGVAGALGLLCLRALGWRIVGDAPAFVSYVLIVAPHTSRWDSIVLSCAILARRLPVYWLGRDTLFRWPFGVVLRAFGGIPVRWGRAMEVGADVRSEMEAIRGFFEGMRGRNPEREGRVYVAEEGEGEVR